jgi:ribosome-binding factor A
LVIGIWSFIRHSDFFIRYFFLMPSRRLLKAAEAIREVVGMAILADLQDPRIRDVTVTGVEVDPDMRHAKVYVSVMGSESKQNLSLRGLQNAAGFLQSKVARRIDTRYTPRLTFVLDQGVKKQIEVSQILGRVLGEERAAYAPDADVKTGSTEDITAEEGWENHREEHPPDDSAGTSR